MAFKHGMYGEHSAYAGKKTTKSLGTIPVYIGTAPIHQNNAENAEKYDYSEQGQACHYVLQLPCLFCPEFTDI